MNRCPDFTLLVLPQKPVDGVQLLDAVVVYRSVIVQTQDVLGVVVADRLQEGKLSAQQLQVDHILQQKAPVSELVAKEVEPFSFLNQQKFAVYFIFIAEYKE